MIKRFNKLLCVNTESHESFKNGPLYRRIKKFSERFDRVYILSISKKKKFNEGSIHYLYGNLLDWIKYNKDYKDSDFVFTSNFFDKGILALIISKIIRKPLVMRCGSPWIYKIDSFSKFLKFLLVKITKPLVIKNCRKVVYNSKSIIQKQYKHDYSVVYNGVDTNEFRPLKVKKASSKFNVIFIGRISKEKGFNYLFEAIQQVSDKVHLGVIGVGPLLNVYKKRYPFVKFYGNVAHNNIPRYINQYDCLILPSLHESFPNALLEAMSCGKPVIATNVFGIPEMIKNNKTGLLISPKDSNAIKNAILRLMNDKKLTFRLGSEAREEVLRRFESERQLNKLADELFGDHNEKK